jgi:hypothetical protein
MACELGAQRCAETGAAKHQLTAPFGWTTTKQAAIYNRKANRTKLDSEAARLLEAQTSNESAPTFSNDGVRRDNKTKKPLVINGILEPRCPAAELNHRHTDFSASGSVRFRSIPMTWQFYVASRRLSCRKSSSAYNGEFPGCKSSRDRPQASGTSDRIPQRSSESSYAREVPGAALARSLARLPMTRKNAGARGVRTLAS